MIINILIFTVLAIAMILSLIASVWMLVEAFRVHIFWGLALIFFPVLGIVFLILHWEAVKKPFFLNLLATLILMILFVVSWQRNSAASPLEVPAVEQSSSFSLSGTIEEFKQAAVERKARAEIANRGFQGRRLDDVERELGIPQGKIMYDGLVEYKYTDRGLTLISTNGVTVTDEIRQ